tara:strand:- start:682 stop:1089 length:408 start_codon:yes stop_codon:yes gene_type:complete
MVYFNLKDAGTGAGLWAIVMGLAIMMMYLPLIPFREVILTIIFPVLLTVLTRNKHFFVSLPVIAIAGIMTFIYSLLLKVNANVRKAQKDPLKEKTVSAASYTSTVICFFVSIIIVAKFVPMYDYRGSGNVIQANF